MRRLFLVITIVAVLGGCTSVAPPRAADQRAIDELANAERAFAAAALASGVKAAFLGVLDKDAMLFRPGPVEGRSWFAAQGEQPYRLEWQPERVAVAASGDLGYSSGPYRLTLPAKPEAPLFGEFLSVWQRGADGRWRVLIDHGNGHAGESGWNVPLQALVGDGTVAPGDVNEAEDAFARRAEFDGLAVAYRLYASSRLRRLRDDVAPLDGPSVDGGERWTWTRSVSDTSRANDFAWTVGRWTTSRLSGVYVRVWRAERGEWKILADVATPVPE